MTTLVIDRSTAKTAVVLAEEGGAPRAVELGIWSTSGSAAPLDGDARRGKYWIALFDGFSPEREIFQVERDGLLAAVPGDASVVSPDFARIGGILAETFGERASAAPTLDAAWLHRAALANPALLSAEPLPVYLNPAVRT